MKTAICFSGHLRTFKDVIFYLNQNVIEPLNCDIFIHTWDTIGSPTNKNPGDNDHLSTSTYDYLSLLNTTLNAKDILIENQEIYLKKFIDTTDDIVVPEDEKKFIMKHIGYHISMFYSIFKSNELKKQYENSNNFKYDLVIRCRPDIRFGTVFHQDMFPENKVYLPKIAQYCNEGLNDQVAVGPSNLIDVYSDIYLSIEEYYRNHSTTARPEAMIKHHLDINNVNYEMIDIIYDIYRLDGGILRQESFDAKMLEDRWK